jgi:hydroxypyruvate isomerase
MQRRDFLRSGVAAGATALTALTANPLGATSRASTRRLDVRSTAEGFRQSVCKWCFPDMSLEELAVAAKEIGIQSIELLDPDDFPTLQKHGLECAMVNGAGGITEGWNRLENHDRLVAGFEERIPLVAAAGFPNIIAFSGNREGMDDEQGLENCVTGLRRILPAAERHGVTVCMELLNSKVNHPDYMCDRTPWGVELVKRLDSDRFKLLYDIYHMQIMEGDVIRTIRDNQQYFGHYHTAGNPGRNELDENQELFYPAIMRAIKETGFTGFVAQEFIPTRDPVTSLREAYQLCNV